MAMANYVVVVPFSWAFRGCDVVDFVCGDEFGDDDVDLVEVAKSQGWIEECSDDAAPVIGPSEPAADPAAPVSEGEAAA
jgi:hypothetical protein